MVGGIVVGTTTTTNRIRANDANDSNDARNASYDLGLLEYRLVDLNNELLWFKPSESPRPEPYEVGTANQEALV